MRIRSRTIIHSDIPSSSGSAMTAETHYCNGSPSVYTPTTSGALPYLITDYTDERMVDTTSKAKLPNAVFHRSRRLTVNTDNPLHGGWFNASSWGQWANAPLQWSQGPSRKTRLEVIVYDLSTSTPPTGWSMGAAPNESILIENCFEKARQLKADVLLNIVESNQIWPSIVSLTTSLPNMAKNWKNLRKVVRTASGGFLAWKFGVSPILSDVMAINRYLPKIKEDFARAYAGKPSRHSSSADVGMSFNIAPIETYENSYVVDRIEYVGSAIRQPKVRYVLVVKPTTQYKTQLFSALDTCMSRFATSPASLAWERVPFSFVVDWLVDLRGACRALDKAIGFEPFQVSSFTRSFTYRTFNQVQWSRYTPCSGSAIFENSCGSVECSHYERSKASTAATMPSWRPRLGKNQAAISAALISQALTKL